MRSGKCIVRLSWPAILGAILLASCSSLPKGAPSTVAAEKARADDLIKVGDDFLAKGQYEAAAKYYDEALQANSGVDNLEGVAMTHTS
ncbi:MAG: hypothetical protein Q8M76_05990, partial [Spirochaetaceae bacterium]|nr:hypothetical protein [Spirochaetaceae bacterium]